MNFEKRERKKIKEKKIKEKKIKERKFHGHWMTSKKYIFSMCMCPS